MGRLSTKTWADSLIAVSFAGSILTFPLQDHVWGQLCFIGFSAATVGGLADSFAVSALFRDPLRIKWPEKMGTRIISRNRERLLQEIVQMVQHELLTPESIQAKLDKYRFSDLVLAYLNDHGGKRDVCIVFQKVASDLLNKLDLANMACAAESFLQTHAGAIQLSDVFADVAEWSLKNKYDDKIISFLSDELTKMVKSPVFRSRLEELIQTALQSYESDRFMRKAFHFIAGIKAGTLSENAQNWLVHYLKEIRSPSHPFRKQLNHWFKEIIERLRTDEVFRNRVEQAKQGLIDSLFTRAGLAEPLREWLEGYRQVAAAAEQTGSDPFPWLNGMLDNGLQKFAGDRDKRDRLDGWLKDKAMEWIHEQHEQIGRLVWEKLNAYNDQEFIAYVEAKAGRDLQYIRLNGTVVGGLLGILIFAMKALIERVIFS